MSKGTAHVFYRRTYYKPHALQSNLDPSTLRRQEGVLVTPQFVHFFLPESFGFLLIAMAEFDFGSGLGSIVPLKALLTVGEFSMNVGESL